MPVKIRLEEQVLRVTPSGEYTWGEIHSAVRRAMRNDGFAAGQNVLLFDSERTEASRSADELRDIAADLTQVAPSFAAVMIVAPDDLRFGLARMLAAYAEHLGAEVLVFRSRDAADAWIRARGGRAGRPQRAAPPDRTR